MLKWNHNLIWLWAQINMQEMEKHQIKGGGQTKQWLTHRIKPVYYSSVDSTTQSWNQLFDDVYFNKSANTGLQVRPLQWPSWWWTRLNAVVSSRTSLCTEMSPSLITNQDQNDSQMITLASQNSRHLQNVPPNTLKYFWHYASKYSLNSPLTYPIIQLSNTTTTIPLQPITAKPLNYPTNTLPSVTSKLRPYKSFPNPHQCSHTPQSRCDWGADFQL